MINQQIIENVETIIRQAADEIICPYFRNLKENTIRTKTSENDLVTIADIEAENFLTLNLSKVINDSMVLGEESYYLNPEIKSFLQCNKPVWIIDPIDGTANFAKGSPIFGLMVSLVVECETIAGWIFDPLQRRMFFGCKGEGVLRNGQRLPVFEQKDRQLSDMVGCLGSRRTVPFEKIFKNLMKSGCSAYDYMSICEGTLDFRYFKSLNPWDHASGMLLIQELGGCGCIIGKGTRYTPIFHDSNTMLVAQNQDEWEMINSVLK